MKEVTTKIYEFDELSDRAKETAIVEINMLFGSSYFKTEQERDDFLRTRDYRANGFSYQSDESIERVRLENEKHGI